MICFECGKKIHAPLQRFVSQDVHGENSMSRIYAHLKCAEESPNKWPGVEK